MVSRSFGIRKDTEEQPRHSRSAIFTKPRGRWGKPRCGQSAFLKCLPLQASVLLQKNFNSQRRWLHAWLRTYGLRHRAAPITYLRWGRGGACRGPGQGLGFVEERGARAGCFPLAGAELLLILVLSMYKLGSGEEESPTHKN